MQSIIKKLLKVSTLNWEYLLIMKRYSYKTRGYNCESFSIALNYCVGSFVLLYKGFKLKLYRDNCCAFFCLIQVTDSTVQISCTFTPSSQISTPSITRQTQVTIPTVTIQKISIQTQTLVSKVTTFSGFIKAVNL